MPIGGTNPDAYGTVPTGTAGTLTTGQMATVPVAIAGGAAASTLGSNLAPYIGAAISGAASIWGQSRANRANRELAEYQNQWNLKQWERQMEYNLPINQMQRLRDAGINPNMAYAKGTINNVTNQRPTAAKPADQKNIIPNISLAQLMLQMKMQEAQINNLNAQTANTNQETLNKQYTGEKIMPAQLEKLSAEITGQNERNRYLKFVGDLAQDGFTVSDPKWLRATWTLLDKNGKNPAQMSVDVIQKIYNWFTTEAPDVSYTNPSGLPMPSWLINLLR